MMQHRLIGRMNRATALTRHDCNFSRFWQIRSLFLLLEEEPVGDDISPRLFPVDGQNVVLAFDSEARLSEFADGVAAYAALPGRIVAQLLAQAQLGLGLNLDVAPSSMLLPPEALVWLVETLQVEGPGESEEQIERIERPRGMPDMLLESLGARLTQSAGLAREAMLAKVTYRDGRLGHLLAIIGAEGRAEPALARSVNEALTFSGLEAAALDVVFLPPGAEIVERLRKVAMVYEIPQPEAREILLPEAPGSNPDKPPRLH